MRLGPFALLAVVCLLPTVNAQVPTPPEPETLVSLACDTVGSVESQARDVLPVCEAQEPPAPANGNDTTAPPAPTAPPAASPEAAQDLALDAIDKLDDIPEDPTSAPQKLQEIAALVGEFVKRLLDIPAAVGDTLATAAEAVGDAASAAGAAVAGATTSAMDTVKSAAAAVGDALASFFDAPTTAPMQTPSLPTDAPVKAPLLKLPLGEIRQVLSEG
jgi:hypothetical protein